MSHSAGKCKISYENATYELVLNKKYIYIFKTPNCLI